MSLSDQIVIDNHKYYYDIHMDTGDLTLSEYCSIREELTGSQPRFKCCSCRDVLNLRDMVQYPHSRNTSCPSCAESFFSEPVKNYWFKPEPFFRGNIEEDLMFGCEIEVCSDRDNYDEDNDDEEWEVCDAHPYNISKMSDNMFYCKSDSSINHGFEIVTHPFTLKWEKENGALKKLFKYLSTHDFAAGRDDHEDSCGIHFHISKQSVSGATMKRVAEFFKRYPSLIYRLSHRRNRYHFERFANIQYLSPRIIETGLVDGGSHHNAINATANTYEIRIFNSTRNYEEYMYFAEMVHGLIRYFSVQNRSYNDRRWISYMEEHYDHWNGVLASEEELDAQQQQTRIVVTDEDISRSREVLTSVSWSDVSFYGAIAQGD